MQETEFLAQSSVNRIRMIISGSIAALALVSIALGSQPEIPGELQTLVSEGIDLILRQNYDQADSVFRVAVNKFPRHPLGYLYRAAVLQTKTMDYLDPLDIEPFDALLATAKSESEKLVEQYPKSALGYFFLGTAEGYDAYSRVDAVNWIAGITKGLAAASDFKKAVELDSTLYDAYVGVGTYYYWKSRKTDFLNWVLGDRRADGIRMLELASQKAADNRYAALSALTAIYTDARKYDQAIDCAIRGLRRYPENRIFLWGLAAAQEQSSRFADAAQTYRHLLENILAARISNPYNEMLCRLNLVKACLALKQSTGLRPHLDAILAYEHYPFPEYLVERAKDKFKQARNIRSGLVVE